MNVHRPSQSYTGQFLNHTVSEKFQYRDEIVFGQDTLATNKQIFPIIFQKFSQRPRCTSLDTILSIISTFRPTKYYKNSKNTFLTRHASSRECKSMSISTIFNAVNSGLITLTTPAASRSRYGFSKT